MEQRSKLANLLKQKYPKSVYIKIFDYLKDENHSVNSNGIFFNLAEIPDESILNCINYIEQISYNIEDHIKNLSLREETESAFKTKITKTSSIQKQKKGKEVPLMELPVKKHEYKGVYKRLDRVLRGLKADEKNIRKIEEVDETEDPETVELQDEVEVEDEEEIEDLFGNDSDIESNSDILEK
jgi:hypothetical protein